MCMCMYVCTVCVYQRVCVYSVCVCVCVFVCVENYCVDNCLRHIHCHPAIGPEQEAGSGLSRWKKVEILKSQRYQFI